MILRFNAQCPECRIRVRISADKIDLVVCEYGAQYGWLCVGCHHRQTCTADEETVRFLRVNGVLACVIPPETGGRGEPIDEADVLRFLASSRNH